MPLKTEPLGEPGLNLTSMLDVVMLLIIFFMVGTKFTELEREYEIQVPTVAEAAPLTGLPDELVVNVQPDGTLVVNGQPVTPEALEALLRQAKENYAHQAVLIRADGQGPYQHVMDVMSLARRAGITNIQLANRLQGEG
jgi:biopolymer transport protein ExbD